MKSLLQTMGNGNVKTPSKSGKSREATSSEKKGFPPVAEAKLAGREGGRDGQGGREGGTGGKSLPLPRLFLTLFLSPLRLKEPGACAEAVSEPSSHLLLLLRLPGSLAMEHPRAESPGGGSSTSTSTTSSSSGGGGGGGSKEGDEPESPPGPLPSRAVTAAATTAAIAAAAAATGPPACSVREAPPLHQGTRLGRGPRGRASPASSAEANAGRARGAGGLVTGGRGLKKAKRGRGNGARGKTGGWLG